MIHIGGVLSNALTGIAYNATQDSIRITGTLTYTSTNGLAGQLCANNATAFIEASAEL